MKRKTIYLLLAGLFLVATFLLSSDVLYPESLTSFRIQKGFYVPCVFFFLIGVSKQWRNINPLAELLIIACVALVSDPTKVFITNGVDWVIIGIVVASCVVSYFIRWFVDSIFKEPSNEKQ